MSRGGGGGDRTETEVTAKTLLEQSFPDTLKKHIFDTPKKGEGSNSASTTPVKKKEDGAAASNDDTVAATVGGSADWLSPTDENAAIDGYLKAVPDSQLFIFAMEEFLTFALETVGTKRWTEALAGMFLNVYLDYREHYVLPASSEG